MNTLVFLLEEPSAKEMLKGILPRLLPEHIQPQFIVFEGKQDMHKKLVTRLRYWQTPDSYFIILRDQDSGDCKKIKQDLQALCQEAGQPSCLVRIACHELESFYLGDLAAVEAGLHLSGLARQQNNRKYRQPDQLANAAQELSLITGKTYQKLAGSRRIAPHLNLQAHANTSLSFQALISGIKKVVQAAPI